MVKLDKNFDPVEIESRETSGLAHQKATEFTDEGCRCRIIPPEDADDVAYLFDQVTQKREMGFIREYGHIPNGARKGDGCRTIGKMIYPAFGGMLEGSEGASDQGSQPESLKTPVPLPLSSKDLENSRKKIVFHIGENGLN